MVNKHSQGSVGVSIENTNAVSFENCIIESNAASGGGGGVKVTNSTASFDGCWIRNNNATDGGGTPAWCQMRTDLISRHPRLW